MVSLFPLDKKQFQTFTSVYASQVTKNHGFALTRYYSHLVKKQVVVETWCTGKSIDGLVSEMLSSLEKIGEKPVVRDPFAEDDHNYPIIEIGGKPKIIEIFSPEYCLNFDQPAVWSSKYAEELHKKEMPCLTRSQQKEFLRLLLPYAKRA